MSRTMTEALNALAAEVSGAEVYKNSYDPIAVYPACVIEPDEMGVFDSNEGFRIVGPYTFDFYLIDKVSNYDSIDEARAGLALLFGLLSLSGYVEGRAQMKEMIINDTRCVAIYVRIITS